MERNQEWKETGIDYFVFINEYEDYPFTKWDTYFRAFAFQLEKRGSIDFNRTMIKKYPNYGKYLNSGGYSLDFDLSIVKELCHKLSPQEGLSGFVQVIKESKCTSSILDLSFLEGVIKLLIERGAVVDHKMFDMILTPQFTDRKMFQTEMENRVLVNRSLLLKVLLKYKEYKEYREYKEYKECKECKECEPIYWEDMVDMNYKLKEEYSYKQAYCNALKYLVESDMY